MGSRDWLITRSYHTAFIADLVFTFLNLATFFFISEWIGPVEESLGDAPSYFAYAAVGMAMTVVIQSASLGLGGRVREEQFTGTLEYLAAQPVSASEISLGLGGFAFALATFRAALYIVASLLFVDENVNPDWIGFLLILIATGLAVSGLGIALGGIILVFKRGESIAAGVIYALGILGGAVFPIEVLPPLLEKLGQIVPTRFAFEGLRSALYVGTGWEDDLGWLLLTTAVILPIGIFLFDRALSLSKKHGSIGEY